MRSFLRLMTLAAALPLTSLALTGCSSNEGPTGKMDASMDKDKTGGAMEPAKPDRGSMETGKMDGAMDKGKMDGAMDKDKMDGATDKGKMDGAPR